MAIMAMYASIAKMKLFTTPPAITKSLFHAGLVRNSHSFGSDFSCSVSRDSSTIPAILQ